MCTSNIRRFHSLHAIIMPIAACYLNIFYLECGLMLMVSLTKFYILAVKASIIHINTRSRKLNIGCR